MNQGIIPSADEIRQAFNYIFFELNPEDGKKTGIAASDDGKMFHTNHGGVPLYEQKYDNVLHFKAGQSLASIGKDKITLWTDETGKVHSRSSRY